MSPNNFPPPLNREPTHRNTARDTFFSFVKAINDHDVQSLSRLMSDDHTFIDPLRHTISGRANMIAGWQKYFAWFPDYAIHVEAALDEGETIVAYGSASGSFGKTGSPEDRW